MNNGAFGENFPYSNFHDLNLDWIIKEVKEGRTALEEVEAKLAGFGVDIETFRQYLDNIDDEIQQKIDTEVPEAIQQEVESGGFNQLLSDSHKRRIVFIGDSYGQGWTPDGTFTPWCTLVANAMQLATTDYYISAEGGAGFGKLATDGNQYIPTLIQNAYDNISNPETVTDIVIGIGYNDNLYYDNPTRIMEGISATTAKIKQVFPNAMTHLYAIGFTTNGLTQYKLGLAYREYKYSSSNYQYKNLCQALSDVTYFSTDGIHPIQSGQRAIANSVLKAFNNSEMAYTPQTDKAGANITLQTVVTATPVNVNDIIFIRQHKTQLLAQPTPFKLVTLSNSEKFSMNGTQYYKLAKITNMADLTGYCTERPYEWYPGLFYCSTTDNTSFTTYQAKYAIAQDMANNDNNVYLWVCIQGTSGSGFQNINNIYRFGIQAFNIPLSFIADR